MSNINPLRTYSRKRFLSNSQNIFNENNLLTNSKNQGFFYINNNIYFK